MKRNAWRAQFGIVDLLLLISVAAPWTALLVSQRGIERVEAQISAMRQAAGELSVHDPGQYHAIARTVLDYREEGWQVYLPEGHAYELHMATREIGPRDYPAPQLTQSTDLAAGIREIDLRYDRGKDDSHRFTVTVDGKVVLEGEEPQDWNTSGGSSASHIGKVQETKALQEPLQLKRMHVHVKQPDGTSRVPKGAVSNGLLLWIERRP